MNFLVRGAILIILSLSSPIYSMESEASAIPFDKFQIIDKMGRHILYYISNIRQKSLPLALFIHGSGCTSYFKEKPSGRISGGYQNVLLNEVSEKFHVMVVEKFHVRFLDTNQPPGTAENCSEKFNKEHTLTNYADALKAALNDAYKKTKVNSENTLVIGHSEGAIVAAKLASIENKIHKIAILSGSGPSQLFDFILRSKSSKKVEQLYETYSDILENSMSHKKFAWGHPYIRWASFFSHSTIELLKLTGADIYIAHGTQDKAVPVRSFDAMVVELKRTGEQFQYKRIEGANHSLNLPEDKPGQGMRRIFQEIRRWVN